MCSFKHDIATCMLYAFNIIASDTSVNIVPCTLNSSLTNCSLSLHLLVDISWRANHLEVCYIINGADQSVTVHNLWSQSVTVQWHSPYSLSPASTLLPPWKENKPNSVQWYNPSHCLMLPMPCTTVYRSNRDIQDMAAMSVLMLVLMLIAAHCHGRSAIVYNILVILRDDRW